MKKIIALALAGAALASVASTADAAQGCGRGYHRGWHHRCVPNRGPAVVAPGVAVGADGLVIGNFYRGRGYWDGHRYWRHRYRHHGEWRYR